MRSSIRLLIIVLPTILLASRDSISVTITIIDALAVNNVSTPSRFELMPLYPNPVNSELSISIAIPQKTDIELFIADIKGRILYTIYSGKIARGLYRFKWNAVPNYSSGIYFVILRTNEYKKVEKFVLVR